MFYNISRTLEILPYLSWAILFVGLCFLEVKNYREQLSEAPVPEPGRGGFVPPPGEGYEYYVSAESIVYILKKAKRLYRIYVVQGKTPNAMIKHDRFGSYFIVRCDSSAVAENIIDRSFQVCGQ